MQAHSRDGCRGAESLTSETQENCFSVLSFQSLPFAWNSLALASPIHTQLFLALQRLQFRKTVLFGLVPSKATNFFLVAL